MLKKVFYIALLVLGTAGIASTAFAAFMSTGISVGTVLPGAAGLVFIAYALIHILRPGNIIKIKALRFIIISLVVIGLLSFIAVESLIIIAENTCSRDENANFVIIPGAGIFSDGRLTKTLTNRLDTAFEYLIVHENAICFVSGGKGENEPYTEAMAMKEYLVERGLPASRIIEEQNSSDTLQNMEFCSAMMDDLFPGVEKSAVIITSGYHVFRALFLARNNGIKASAIAAPTAWYAVINNYLREYAGVLHSWVFELK